MVKWQKKFSIGVQALDEQHKILFRFINEINMAVKLNRGEKIVRNIISGLIDYCVYHFQCEEQIFDDYKYPGEKQHIFAHDPFVEKVLFIQAQVENNLITVGHELMQFLINWLSDHILTSDKKYGIWLINNRKFMEDYRDNNIKAFAQYYEIFKDDDTIPVISWDPDYILKFSDLGSELRKENIIERKS